MDTITTAMIIVGASCNIISFLFGVILGRNTAYKAVRTFETADTAHDIPSIDSSP